MAYPNKVFDALGIKHLAVGEEVMALNPLGESQASVSVRRENDRILIHNFGNGTKEAILQAAGLEWSDLFSDSAKRERDVKIESPNYCTLETYARYTRLPLDFLEQLGIRDTTYTERGRQYKAIRMAYLDYEGNFLFNRYRIELKDTVGRFRYQRGAKSTLYGLDRIEEFKQEYGYVILVEGESDAQTLWFYGLPGLGVAGANNWKSDFKQFLRGLKVYVWQETDAGGLTFVENVAKDIPDALVLKPEVHKDVSEYHRLDHDVSRIVNELIEEAQPVPEQEIDVYKLIENVPTMDHKERYNAIALIAREVAQADAIQQELYLDAAKAAGINKSTIRNAMELLRNETQAVDVSLDHGKLRDMYIKRYPLTKIGLGVWRRYENGYWPELNERYLLDEVSDLIEENEGRGITNTAYSINSISTMIGNRAFEEDDVWNSNNNRLVLANCTLDLNTFQTREHNPEDFITRALGYDFDHYADCPNFRKALSTQPKDVQDFIQEFLGLCLTTEVKYEIALWFYGPRGCGKSTIITGFETMLGDYRAHLGLADIAKNRFALSAIEGRRLLTCAEQPDMYIETTDKLNSIISGEYVSIEEKFQKRRDIKPHAKLLWSMNNLPAVSNANDGLFRRVRVIQFDALPKSEQDLELKDQVATEGAGILNFAIEGLKRLQARGHFDIPQIVMDATDAFERGNDKARMFVEECCETGDVMSKTKSSRLYSAYKAWCIKNGYRPKATNKVSDDWRRLGFQYKRESDAAYWYNVELLYSDIEIETM